MRPLLRCLARPMKLEWKMSPYLGVLLFVFSALQCNNALRNCTHCDKGCNCNSVIAQAPELGQSPMGGAAWSGFGKQEWAGCT